MNKTLKIIIMISFILFGGWLFWTIISFFVVVLTYAIEDDQDTHLGWSTFFLLVFGTAFYLSYHSLIETWWRGIAWQSIALRILIYFVIGIVWSFFRWWKYVGIFVHKYKDAALRFHNTSQIIKKEDYIPEASENKERLSTWIVFWPFSIVRYLVGDLLRDITDKIVTFFSGIYDRISVSRFN